VAIVEGWFENRLATVTAREKGGKLTLKLRGRNVRVDHVARHSLRPAFGFDFESRTSEKVPV
jgi:hypothetical protein